MNPRTTTYHEARPMRRGGMTLIEATISLAIVGVMMVAALQTVGNTARSRQAQISQRRGPALARELLSEILPAHYAEVTDTAVFGPESGENSGTRANFDDVDDYHNWSSTQVQSKTGTAYPDLTGWSRSVTVQWVTPDNLDTVASSDTGLKCVTVTVTDPFGRTASLSALRSSTGVYAYAPTVDTTYLSSIGVELQIGPNADVRVVSAANPLNRVPIE